MGGFFKKVGGLALGAIPGVGPAAQAGLTALGSVAGGAMDNAVVGENPLVGAINSGIGLIPDPQQPTLLDILNSRNKNTPPVDYGYQKYNA